MNTKDMLLESASGFMMPFEASEEEEVQVSLGFGEQKHPLTGEVFNHRGVDFITHGLPLFALATGTVVGAGTDAIHENYVIVKYGKFEVKYGHLSEAYVQYGMPVYAGLQIAKSGDFLHFEVNYQGEALDPMEFLAMIYGNIAQLEAMGMKGAYRLANMGVKVKTDYDADQEEILQMMLRWWAVYMNDIRLGRYAPSARMEQSLRNVFAQSADRSYFFETIPNYGNPLGLSSRGAPLASKVQNLLIGDFLNYMALRHDTYLSTWDDDVKKKVREQAAADGYIMDPLAGLQVDVKSFDVGRIASVYFDSEGNRCWTKAWFNGREKGEPAIESNRQLAIAFISDQISKDSWLTRFWPKQMSVYHKAIEQTRQQLLGM